MNDRWDVSTAYMDLIHGKMDPFKLNGSDLWYQVFTHITHSSVLWHYLVFLLLECQDTLARYFENDSLVILNSICDNTSYWGTIFLMIYFKLSLQYDKLMMIKFNVMSNFNITHIFLLENKWLENLANI